jgi:hypothetical protein
LTPSISADGRFVAFASHASNLVPGDTNGNVDVFVHDRQTGLTEIVSVASDGTQGNDTSLETSISADGRFVAFSSAATNLVPVYTNIYGDIFVHDRQTGITEIVSVSNDGAVGNSESFDPSISADGRFVAFSSGANNLVPGDTNDFTDIFMYDRQTGMTERVSVASDGTQGNYVSLDASISVDGRFVAFSSGANNLVPGDIEFALDVFVHDRQTGMTEIVSVASDGTQGNGLSQYPSISADGRFVAFSSLASNFVFEDTNETDDVFVHDRQTGMTEIVSVASDGTQGNSGSYQTSISADGRFVAIRSFATNLVPGYTNINGDIFVHDRQTGMTEIVSVSNDGASGNFGSGESSISADGRFVAFSSADNNLVPGDTNDFTDIFVRDRGPETDLIFADGFESGSFSAWSSSKTDRGDLSVTAQAALAGSYGMQALIDDNRSIYVTDDTPNAEPRYRARFYFDPNSIAMAGGNTHAIFYGYSGASTVVLRIELRFSQGSYRVGAALLDNGATWKFTRYFSISDAAHFIELDWRSATAAGANDGGLTVWIDGAQQVDLTGVDNDTHRVDRIRLGAVSGIDAGTRGTYFFDAFESHKVSYIGP